MMKSRVATAAAILCCLIATTATGQEEKPYQKWMSFFNGHWEWTMPDGAEGEFDWTLEKSPEILTSRGRIEDATWFAVMSWHEGEGVLIDRGFNADGGRTMNRYTNITDEALEGTRSGWTPAGELSGTVRVTKIDKDTFEISVTDRKIGGEAQADLKVEVKRSKAAKVPSPPKADRDVNGGN